MSKVQWLDGSSIKATLEHFVTAPLSFTSTSLTVMFLPVAHSIPASLPPELPASLYPANQLGVVPIPAAIIYVLLVMNSTVSSVPAFLCPLRLGPPTAIQQLGLPLRSRAEKGLGIKEKQKHDQLFF